MENHKGPSARYSTGSHLRAATDAEVAASEPGWDGEQLPGLTTLTLQPGDVVYRHTDMLHRGWNPNGELRWTLISSVWAAEMPMLDIEKQDYSTLSEPGFIGNLSLRLQFITWKVPKYLSFSAGSTPGTRSTAQELDT